MGEARACDLTGRAVRVAPGSFRFKGRVLFKASGPRVSLTPEEALRFALDILAVADAVAETETD